MASFLSSGDLAADRRLDWALASAKERDFDAAADLARQALEIAPRFSAAWFTLAEALEATGRRDDARDAYAQALALAPADPFGAGARLARIDGATPDGLASAYVKGLFDEYAPRFDAHLTQALGYRGPALLRAAMVSRGRARFACALDLGCGTGLSGEALADLCDRIEGCDLSPAMLAQARAKGVYASLDEAELLAFLTARAAASSDLVIAADVFVYLGDLAPGFAQAARVLAPGGLFAFTTQAIEGEGFALLDDLRFGHSASWLREALEQAGFEAIDIAAASTRRDGGRDVPGFVVTAVRRAGA